MTPAQERQPPTTFEYIEGIALREPARLALVEGSGGSDYGSLYLNVIRFTRALDALGIRRGQRVALAAPGSHVQLLLMLACENIGAAVLAFRHEGDADIASVLRLVEWALSPVQLDCPAGVRQHRIDEGFVREALALDPAPATAYPRVALAPHETERLARTSGSTGAARFMETARGAREYRLRRIREVGSYNAASRVALASPLLLSAVYNVASICLREGAAIFFVAGDELRKLRVTHLYGMPLHLEHLLEQLPAGWRSPAPVTVGTLGGSVTPQLRARIVQALGGPVANLYASNEAGRVCDDLDANGVGLLSVGVDVRILDAGGRELPQGQPGVIAVHAPGMVAGYVGDAEATRHAFREGWFVSSDWGVLVGPRRLRLLGRLDDLLVIGGIKKPASQVEALLRAVPGVDDVAVLAVNLSEGAATAGIVVVPDRGASPQALLEAIPRAIAAKDLPAALDARIVFANALPRMPNGKVDRMALHGLLRR